MEYLKLLKINWNKTKSEKNFKLDSKSNFLFLKPFKKDKPSNQSPKSAVEDNR